MKTTTTKNVDTFRTLTDRVWRMMYPRVNANENPYIVYSLGGGWVRRASFTELMRPDFNIDMAIVLMIGQLVASLKDVSVLRILKNAPPRSFRMTDALPRTYLCDAIRDAIVNRLRFEIALQMEQAPLTLEWLAVELVENIKDKVTVIRCYGKDTHVRLAREDGTVCDLVGGDDSQRGSQPELLFAIRDAMDENGWLDDRSRVVQLIAAGRPRDLNDTPVNALSFLEFERDVLLRPDNLTLKLTGMVIAAAVDLILMRARAGIPL